MTEHGCMTKEKGHITAANIGRCAADMLQGIKRALISYLQKPLGKQSAQQLLVKVKIIPTYYAVVLCES